MTASMKICLPKVLFFYTPELATHLDHTVNNLVFILIYSIKDYNNKSDLLKTVYF